MNDNDNKENWGCPDTADKERGTAGIQKQSQGNQRGGQQKQSQGSQQGGQQKRWEDAQSNPLRDDRSEKPQSGTQGSPSGSQKQSQGTQRPGQSQGTQGQEEMSGAE